MPDTTAFPATDHDEQDALLRLLICGAAAAGIRRLLDSHGSAVGALQAGSRDWASHGLDAACCAAIRKPDQALLARGHAWLAAAAHQLIGWSQDDYPPLLRRIPSPPPMLFVDGDAGLLWRPALAIVGSRAATASGPICRCAIPTRPLHRQRVSRRHRCRSPRGYVGCRRRDRRRARHRA